MYSKMPTEFFFQALDGQLIIACILLCLHTKLGRKYKLRPKFRPIVSFHCCSCMFEEGLSAFGLSTQILWVAHTFFDAVVVGALGVKCIK